MSAFEAILVFWLALISGGAVLAVWWIRHRAADAVTKVAVAWASAINNSVCKTCGNTGLVKDLTPCPDCEFGRDVSARDAARLLSAKDGDRKSAVSVCVGQISGFNRE